MERDIKSTGILAKTCVMFSDVRLSSVRLLFVSLRLSFSIELLLLRFDDCFGCEVLMFNGHPPCRRCAGESNTSLYKSFDRFGLAPAALCVEATSRLSYWKSPLSISSSCRLNADPLPESFMLFLRCRCCSSEELGESFGQQPDETSMHVSVELLFCLINNLTKLKAGWFPPAGLLSPPLELDCCSRGAGLWLPDEADEVGIANGNMGIIDRIRLPPYESTVLLLRACDTCSWCWLI